MKKGQRFEYKIRSKVTREKLQKYDDAKWTYYRFQAKDIRLTYRSKSWGMIYSSEAEARREGATIWEGKSCMPTAAEIMNWAGQFNNDNYLVMVFEGYDTEEEGDDGEYICQYQTLVDTFEYDDFVNFMNEKTDRDYGWIKEDDGSPEIDKIFDEVKNANTILYNNKPIFQKNEWGTWKSETRQWQDKNFTLRKDFSNRQIAVDLFLGYKPEEIKIIA